MGAPVEGLRKVLDLERKKNYSDNAVIGGLDRYLLNVVQQNSIPETHRFSEVLRSLPPGGYRALHVVQRKRVVEELLKAVARGLPANGRKEAGHNSTVVHGPGPESRGEAAAEGIDGSPGPALADEPKGLQASTERVSKSERGTEAAARRHASTTAPAAIRSLESPLAVLRLANRKAIPLFAKLGVRTVRDLLFHFPARHEDYLGILPVNELVVDGTQAVTGQIFSVGRRIAGGRRMTEAVISTPGGNVRAVWWNAPWIANRLRQGARVTLMGRVSAFKGRPQFDQPVLADKDDPTVKEPGLRAVYPSTDGLSQRDIRAAVGLALDGFLPKVEETLPPDTLAEHNLPPIRDALQEIHQPQSLETAEQARHRFAFEELLAIEVGVVRRRLEWQANAGAPSLVLAPETLDGLTGSLPFQLTSAQQRAITAVLRDLAGNIPMNRLVEGDVGSGKTVVAAAALLAAVCSGYQGAIMAPTEILAEQHFRTFTTLLNPSPPPSPSGTGVGGEAPLFQETGPGFLVLRPPYLDQPLRLALLKGSLKTGEKGLAQEAISAGDVDIVVGTHAIVQESVDFHRLGLAVVDEQHRFGVGQRAALREKGESPHMLVMTATPIPRTLQLTVFGDLDITVLDEMPPGRPAVKTWRVTPPQRVQAYDFVRKKAAEGRQAYVICPLVEESESIAAKAAVQEYERLSRDVFPDLRLGLLHGRMTPSEKDSTMRSFRDGDIQVLVSTAVVEVGVDVPNATVILIEGADRFGLAQLHQFRGRVRRSSEQAYCFLLSDNTSEEALDRLLIMETVSDGFRLAEEDLRLRGPGEYFGTRQSGLPDLRVARLTDVALIEQTRTEATRLLEEDPELSRREHAALAAEVDRRWGAVTGEVS